MDFSRIKNLQLTREEREFFSGCAKQSAIFAGVGGITFGSAFGYLLKRRQQYTPRVRLIITSLTVVVGVYTGAVVGAQQCFKGLLSLDTPLGRQARQLVEDMEQGKSSTHDNGEERRKEEPDDRNDEQK